MFTRRGLLIPVYAIAGMLLGAVLGIVACIFLGGDAIALAVLGTISGSVTAAAMVWRHALTIGKTTEETMLDAQTGSRVVRKRQHTLFFIPAFAWAVIATVFAG